MADGEGIPGSPQAASYWELEYKLSDQDPQIECTIHTEGEDVRAVRLSYHKAAEGPRSFSDREITTVASYVGTLITVRLEDGGADGSTKHLMVVLPTVPLGNDTPDESTFDHVAAATIILTRKPQPNGVAADRPHQSYETQTWDPAEHSGSSVLVHRRRGGRG